MQHLESMGGCLNSFINKTSHNKIKIGNRMEYIKEALVLSMAASHSPVSVDYGVKNWTVGSGSKAWNPTADAGKNTGEWNKLINERDLLLKM